VEYCKVHRQQSHNAVLLKDDVGRTRPACRDLPGEAHVYGRSNPLSSHDVREAMCWVEHTPSAARPEEQDFQRLNKAALKEHALRPPEVTGFRNNHGTPPQRSRGQSSPEAVVPSEVIPGFSYGQRCRPSTPIRTVIQNHSGAEADRLQDAMYRESRERVQERSRLSFKLTKSTRQRLAADKQRRREESEPPQELWKMSKFKRVPSQLQLPGDNVKTPPPLAKAPVKERHIAKSRCSSLPNLSGNGGYGSIWKLYCCIWGGFV